MSHASYVLVLTAMSFTMAILVSLSALAIDHFVLNRNISLDADMKGAMDDLLRGNVLKSILNEIKSIGIDGVEIVKIR